MFSLRGLNVLIFSKMKLWREEGDGRAAPSLWLCLLDDSGREGRGEPSWAISLTLQTPGSTTPSQLSWGMFKKAQDFQVGRDGGCFLQNDTELAQLSQPHLSAVTHPACSGLTNPVLRMTGEEEVSKRLLWELSALQDLSEL